jgi:cell pole-organizing protein PopZ
MQSAGREPSMEDILASIKKVIAEEKELRTTVRASVAEELDQSSPEGQDGEEDVLELDQPLAPAMDLGPPLVDEHAAGKSRQALEQLQTVASTAPPQAPAAGGPNPLEEIIREMLRPMLKQWLDEHLPQMVDEHVKREISRITGRPL